MGKSDLTHERLRTHHISQPNRERLCAAVLENDRRFTGVAPRRPRGGPDGGRDIEAWMDGKLVFGAVGFRDKVKDDAEDKWYIKKKFRDDLKSAIAADGALWGFAFLTNVDLTPSESEELTTEAKAAGVKYAETFNRDRIANYLDSPLGYALRHELLDIAMDKEEQVAVFATLKGGTESRLDRIEAGQQWARPLETLGFVLDLDREYAAGELADLACFVEIGDSWAAFGQTHPIRLWCTAVVVRVPPGGEAPYWKVKYGAQLQIAGREFNASSGGNRVVPVGRIDAIVDLRPPGEPLKLGDLNKKRVHLRLSRHLIGRVVRVSLVANSYRIATRDIRADETPVPGNMLDGATSRVPVHAPSPHPTTPDEFDLNPPTHHAVPVSKQHPDGKIPLTPAESEAMKTQWRWNRYFKRFKDAASNGTLSDLVSLSHDIRTPRMPKSPTSTDDSHDDALYWEINLDEMSEI